MIGQSYNRTLLAVRDCTWYSAPVKRALDIAITLVALALFAPLFGLIALAIKRDSPGPIFYRGPRVGRGGKVFMILKFRTMYETSVSYSGPRVTPHGDPRVTPLGRWLRDTKMNELPQFWNVLKGDMSLVGPRPEDPTLIQNWPAAARDLILSVRPGITSPASILYRNEELMLRAEDLFRQYTEEVGPDKVRLDQLYVQHRSFCLDLDTILWTTLVILPKIGPEKLPETLVFVGPITRLIQRYMSWFAIDSLVALIAAGCAGLFWRAFGPIDLGWTGSVVAALALALLFSVTGAALGVNRVAWSKAAPKDVSDLLKAWAVAAILAFGASLLLDGLPIGLVVMASFLSLFGFVAVRYHNRLVTGLVSDIMRNRVKARSNRERVLIVGSGQPAQQAAWILGQPGNMQKFQVSGFVDNDLFAQGARVYGGSVVGTWSDIPNLVAERDTKVIILADRTITRDQYHSIAQICRINKTRLVLMPDLVDWLGDLCKGSPLTDPTAGEARHSADCNCIQGLAERGASQVPPLLRAPGGAEIS